jgi:hypothetical protein
MFGTRTRQGLDSGGSLRAWNIPDFLIDLRSQMRLTSHKKWRLYKKDFWGFVPARRPWIPCVSCPASPGSSALPRRPSRSPRLSVALRRFLCTSLPLSPSQRIPGGVYQVLGPFAVYPLSSRPSLGFDPIFGELYTPRPPLGFTTISGELSTHLACSTCQINFLADYLLLPFFLCEPKEESNQV